MQIFNHHQAALMTEEAFVERLLGLVNALNALPTESEVKQRYDGVTYVPIEVVESKLDHFFFGLWETYSFHYQVVVNEMVGHLELAVFNPVAGVWLRRIGTGGVLIQQRAEEHLDEDGSRVRRTADVLDVSKKIPNALESAMGHLKADCIKNAAKSLGNSFGRNLMRDIQNDSIKEPEYTSMAEFVHTINQMTDKESLVLYFKEMPTTVRNDKRYRNEIKRREMEIANESQTNIHANEEEILP